MKTNLLSLVLFFSAINSPAQIFDREEKVDNTVVKIYKATVLVDDAKSQDDHLEKRTKIFESLKASLMQMVNSRVTSQTDMQTNDNLQKENGKTSGEFSQKYNENVKITAIADIAINILHEEKRENAYVTDVEIKVSPVKLPSGESGLSSTLSMEENELFNHMLLKEGQKFILDLKNNPTDGREISFEEEISYFYFDPNDKNKSFKLTRNTEEWLFLKPTSVIVSLNFDYYSKVLFENININGVSFTLTSASAGGSYFYPDKRVTVGRFVKEFNTGVYGKIHGSIRPAFKGVRPRVVGGGQVPTTP